MNTRNSSPRTPRRVPLWLALIPAAVLFISLAILIPTAGAEAIGDYSPWVLLAAAATGALLSLLTGGMRRRGMRVGLRRAASQLLPAIPMLILIALLSTSWMMSGVVPAMVTYGMDFISPRFFLVVCCLVCALVSVLTGSSWSTIATIGVAFIGIGGIMGHSAAWTAGAVISGAYFGDKISPLSDTTVIASATCEVEIFDHIRYMFVTTFPALLIALVVFAVKGFSAASGATPHPADMAGALSGLFNLSPWLLLIPASTVVMIAMRVPTLLTLGLSSLAGTVTALFAQPALLSGGGFISRIAAALKSLLSGFSLSTGSDSVDALVSTGGVAGIMPVVFLVLSALAFGWVMIGTGMLETITDSFTRRLRRPVSIVSASIASGLTLNACTADQYLSIILGGNMYRSVYRSQRLENRLLSRTLEDAVSATSPLIPWSSCGVTQATVLGVSTIAYLPYCIFNYLTPLMAVAVAATGWDIRRRS